MNRAFSTFTVKSASDSGVIVGIASTPAADRVGDEMDPAGATFTLPMPLLWQHRHDEPIGHVTEAKVTPAGIEIVARVVRGVDAVADRAWNLIKGGLVRGLSIGFRPLEQSRNAIGGMRVRKWAWYELSAVTLPCNEQATITAIKAAWHQEQPRPARVPDGAVAFDPDIAARLRAALARDNWSF